MPFTLSHAVAILPFARTPLAPAALALGSMVPDLPYFLPFGISRDFSHSVAGAPTIDLLVGAVAFTLWVLVLRAPALDYAPSWLRERMQPRARWRVRGVVVSGLLVVAALELGILTHLLLDLFTHEGGWLETVAPWTAIYVGPVAVANMIHAGVTVVASTIVVVWVRRWVLRTPRRQQPAMVGRFERIGVWIGLLVVLGTTGLTFWISGIASGLNPLTPDLLGSSFIRAAAITGVGVALVAAVWQARRWARPGPDQPRG